MHHYLFFKKRTHNKLLVFYTQSSNISVDCRIIQNLKRRHWLPFDFVWLTFCVVVQSAFAYQSSKSALCTKQALPVLCWRDALHSTAPSSLFSSCGYFIIGQVKISPSKVIFTLAYFVLFLSLCISGTSLFYFYIYIYFVVHNDNLSTAIPLIPKRFVLSLHWKRVFYI